MKSYVRLSTIIGMLFFSSILFCMLSNKILELQKKFPFKYSAFTKLATKNQTEIQENDFSQMHLVPTDSDTLKLFGLCPLFTQQEGFILEKELIDEIVVDFKRQGLNDADIKNQLASLSTNVGPQYHIFKENRIVSSGQEGAGFEEKNVSMDAPCTIALGAFGNWNRTLLQLKSLDQFELADKTNLSPALCAGHALNNARLICNYALTGELKYLKQLHDINDATNFLLDLEINDWLNVETVKQNIVHVGKLLNADMSVISAVSAVALFDSNLKNSPGFVVYNLQEFMYVQELKKKMQEGLKQENYFHVLIVGNEEATISHGHYFAFAIIKVGNEIQYVVLDTLPGIYHLQPDSHERDRLMFVIENIEQGYSSITLANLRTRPEFMQSMGEQNEDSKLEGALIQERLQEGGIFADEVAALNGFSKQLNRFGVKKQLRMESLEDLLNYLQIIHTIGDVLGQEQSYPILRKEIEQELVNRK